MKLLRLCLLLGMWLLAPRPTFAQEVITNVMSPIASYQYPDDLSSEALTNGGVESPIISYEYLEDFGSGALTNGGVLSPIVSYQYLEWPGGGILNLDYSPTVSYYYPILGISGPTVLHGHVTDASGNPLSGATVAALVYLTPVAQATTDANGNYQMPSVDAGAYNLEAWDSTHQTAFRSLTLNANTAEQNFQLQPLAPTPATQQVNRQPAAFVFPPIGSLGEQLEIFDGTQFVAIDPTHKPSPNQMTIVLTHGWTPTIPSPSGPIGADSWPSTMAAALMAQGITANILAWDWRYASEAPYPPEENTPAEGVLLGQSLQTVLGANYSQPVHFIGHSLGTLVNANAANYLHGDRTAQQTVSPTPWTSVPIHMTLLDEAEVAIVFNGVEAFFDGLTVELANLGVPLALPPAGALQGWKSPIPVHSSWVDNYVSDFGFYHPGIVNVRLEPGGNIIANHGYAWVWYDMTIVDPSHCVLGFQRSYEARIANLSAFDFPPSTSDFPPGTSYLQSMPASDPLVLAVQPPPVQTLGDLANRVVQDTQAAAQYAGDVTANIVDDTQQASQLVSQGFNYVTGIAAQGGQTVLNYLSSSVLQLTLTTTPPTASSPQARGNLPRPLGSNDNSVSNTPAMVWLPLQIPSTASAMAFDFTVSGDPADDSLVCGIGTNNLFSLQAQYIPTNAVSASRLIDVTTWAGTTNELFFGFLGGTSTNATLTIDNIRFYSFQLTSLQAQAIGGNLILSWPMSTQNYSLQTTTNLADPNSWVTLTNVPAIVNLQNTVTNSVSAGMRFYRLKQ